MNVPTVLVIGAGASKPYGLPLGSELVPLVIDEIESEDRPPPGTFGASKPDGAHHVVVYQERCGRLVQRLRNSRAPTIDRLLEQSEADRSELVRAIIRVIWKKEESACDAPPSEDDWISWLWWNRLRQGPGCFGLNQLVVVSFNYDRLPQILWANQMAATCVHDISLSWQAVTGSVQSFNQTGQDRFLHAHGSIGVPPIPDNHQRVMNCSFDETQLDDACRRIGTIGQPNWGDGDPRKASDWHCMRYESLWAWAERVYFLGVGYHVANMEHIGLSSEKIQAMTGEKQFVGGTAFGLDEDLRSRVRAWGGARFVLGDHSARCDDFLKEHMRASADS